MDVHPLSATAIAFLRLHKSGLGHEHFRSMRDVARRLVGVQSQDLWYAGINAMQRMTPSVCVTSGRAVRRRRRLWQHTQVLFVCCAMCALLPRRRLWTHENVKAEVYGKPTGDESRTLELWGQRGTLHVYSIDDWSLIVGALAHDADRAWMHRRATLKTGGFDAFLAVCRQTEQVRASRAPCK